MKNKTKIIVSNKLMESNENQVKIELYYFGIQRPKQYDIMEYGANVLNSIIVGMGTFENITVGLFCFLCSSLLSEKFEIT